MLGVGCAVPMPYYNTLVATMFGPIIVIAIIFTVYKTSPEEEKQDAWNTAMSRLQLFIFLAYPLCSAVVLQVFNCR